MPNKYPEHIDQLEHFYQQELAELEVAPPSNMWDKISASGEEEQNKKGFWMPFSTTQKIIVGIIILSIFVGISSYFYFNTTEETSPSLQKEQPKKPLNSEDPEEEQSSLTPSNSTTQSSSIKEREKKRSVDINQSIQAQATEKTNESSTEQTNTGQESQTITEETKDNASHVTIEQEEPIVEKAVKKKVSFKDKHKKDYQDSTRNLFVPGK